jgi:hypothetical protein
MGLSWDMINHYYYHLGDMNQWDIPQFSPLQRLCRGLGARLPRFERGAAGGARHADRDGAAPAKWRGAPFFGGELLGEMVDLYEFITDYRDFSMIYLISMDLLIYMINTDLWLVYMIYIDLQPIYFDLQVPYG